MGSIPLAALNVRPPEQQQNPLGTLAQLMQLKQQQALMPGQLQQQQQQIQSTALDVQQKQQQIADQKAITTAYQQWDGKNPDDLGPLVTKNGGSGTARIGVQKAYLALKEQYSTIAKNDAETGSKNIETLKNKNDMALGALKTMDDVPDEQLGQHLAQTVQTLAQQQTLDPQHAQQGLALAQAVQNGQVSAADARKALAIYEKTFQSNSQQLDQAAKEAETAKNAAQALKIKAEMEFYQKKGLAPGVPLDVQEAQAWLNKNPDKDLADFLRYKSTLVPQFNFNLQAGGVNNPPVPKGPSGEPLQGADLYNTFGGKAGVVKAIVEGRQSPPASFAQKSPYWQDVMQKVYQVDPQFNEQRAQLRKAFTTGPDAKNIGALNTAAVHLDTLSEAAKALNNGTFRPGNQAFNAIKTMFGASAPNTFEGIRDAVASEMANALKGNATDIEIAGIKKTIMASSSPEQLTNLVNAHLHILNQKLNTYKERYEQQNPGDTVYSPVLPSAGAVFQKHGVGGGSAQGGIPPAAAGMVNVQLSDGRTGSIKAENKDKFLKNNPGSKVLQ